MYIIACEFRRRARVFAPNKGINMFNKLGIGDTFPNVTLNLVDGGTLDLPGGLGDGYRVILFYRGHW